MNSLLQIVVFVIYVANIQAFQSNRFNIKSNVNLNMKSNGNVMKMMASTAEKKRVVIVGATGYIGKFVVKESIRRGIITQPLKFLLKW